MIRFETNLDHDAEVYFHFIEHYKRCLACVHCAVESATMRNCAFMGHVLQCEAISEISVTEMITVTEIIDQTLTETETVVIF